MSWHTNKLLSIIFILQMGGNWVFRKYTVICQQAQGWQNLVPNQPHHFYSATALLLSIKEGKLTQGNRHGLQLRGPGPLQLPWD